MDIIKRLINAAYIIASIAITLFGAIIIFNASPIDGVIIIAVGLLAANFAARAINYVPFGTFIPINTPD